MNINGDEIKSNTDKPLFKIQKDHQVMSYTFSKNESLLIEFIVPSFEEFEVNIYETKFDLLENNLINIKKRASDMMPKPYITSDATVIVKRLNFPIYEQ